MNKNNVINLINFGFKISKISQKLIVTIFLLGSIIFISTSCNKGTTTTTNPNTTDSTGTATDSIGAITIDTTIQGRKVTLGATADKATGFSVNWGDNSTEQSFATDAKKEHTYEKAGEYEIKVTASATGFESKSLSFKVTLKDEGTPDPGGDTTKTSDFPITFDDAAIDYLAGWKGFQGGKYEVVDNPSKTGKNTSAKVGKYTKTAEADAEGNAASEWGGVLKEYADPIDFKDKNTLKIKLYGKAGTKVIVKFENKTNNNISTGDNTATLAADNTWEEFSFTITADNPAGYHKLVLINNTGGKGEGEVIHFDDIDLINDPSVKPPVDLKDLALPITFEDASVDYSEFKANNAGGSFTVVDNPVKTGKNTSAKVGKYVESEEGTYPHLQYTFDSKIPFSGTSNGIKFKLKPENLAAVGAEILVKIELPNPEDPSKPENAVEKAVEITSEDWEEYEVGFNDNDLNHATTTYSRIVFFYGELESGSKSHIFYIDDIDTATVVVAPPPPPLPDLTFPITFEAADVDYSGFVADGTNGVFSVSDNPDKTGNNTSAKAGYYLESDGGTGTYPNLQYKFSSASKIPFVANGANGIKFKIKAGSQTSTINGKKITVKVEGDGIAASEADVTMTSEDWTEYEVALPGIDPSKVYNKLVFFYDGAAGGSINNAIYIDDIDTATVAAAPPASSFKAPTTVAPAQNPAHQNKVNIYEGNGNASPDLLVTPQDWGAESNTVTTEVDVVAGTGDGALKLETTNFPNGRFSGYQFNLTNLVAAGQTHIHIDLYTNMDGFKIKPIEAGAGGTEGGGTGNKHEYALNITNGSYGTFTKEAWSSFDIPIADFQKKGATTVETDYSFQEIFQFVIEGESNGIAYIDNIYSYTP